jgi:PAS domain S-box-containing protein
MNLFRNISIKNKVTIITMSACMIVLLLLLVSFTLLEFVLSRNALVEKMAALAEVIEINSTAALTFNDMKSAEATLGSLNAEPEIMVAAIYTKKGDLFALYYNDDYMPKVLSSISKLPWDSSAGKQPPSRDSHRNDYIFHTDRLEMAKRIVMDGEPIGTLYLQTNLDSLYRRLKWYSLFAFMALFPALLVAYLLASKFQRIISKPITDLAQTMKIVSQEQNYSVQVEKFSEDELGGLTDSFNEMLAQVQKRDLALGRHREELEMEVERRTAELSRSNRELEKTIDELNRATQFLAQNEKRLAYAQQAARLGYWEWLIDSDKLIWSGEVCRVFGLGPEEIGLTRQTFLDLILPGDRESVKNAMDNSLSTGQPFGVDACILTLAGPQQIVNLQGEIIINEAGNPIKMTGTIQDITERKAAEQALSASEEKYRALMNNAGEGILLADIDGNHLEANKKMIDLLGYPIEELLQLKFLQIIPSEDVERATAAFKELRAIGSGTVDNATLLRKDGKRIPVDITTSLVSYSGKIVVQGIFRDVSERQKMEEERLLLSKLESLGLLAGGIAHDFNNILTAILGNISLARMEAEQPHRAGKFSATRLEEAEKACQRAQALASQLLSFAKGGQPIKKVTSVAALIEESSNLSLSGSKARTKLVIPPDLWHVEVDDGQISQVFNNLLINADQAMPAGGTITVQAENAMLGDELPLPKGRYVKIAISDQGIGIPSNYLGKIFDPYFTTKQKGSGLGLASVHSMIRNNAGYITVESQVGVGTTFYLYLPAVEGEITSETESATRPMQGHGRILLMDDEEMVRNVLGVMLERLGYEVQNAVNGEEAIKKYIAAQQEGRPFTALIFDLTVPGGMGGREALHQILDRDPEAKAIVSSGYSDDPIMADFQKYGFSDVLVKPYRMLELSKILQKVIFNKNN